MNNNKRLFAKNSITGVVQKILIAILTFVTIPVFIRLLGMESFGIFATISVLGDLSRLTNVGFHIALIKFLSLQGRTQESSYDILVGFTSMLLIMVVVSSLLIFFNNYIILNIFNISVENFTESRVLYNYLVLANAFLFIGMPLSAVLESQKMIYKVNYLQLVYSFFYWGAMLIVLALGYDLRTVGLVAFLAALVWFILTLILARMAWGPLKYGGLLPNYLKSVKKQLGYGVKVYFSGLLALFLEPLTKILVANFFGVAFVGFIDIGLRIKNQLSRIIRTALWPLFQHFAELTDKKEIARIVNELQEKLTLLIIVLNVILIFSAKSLVTLWIGEDVEIITMTLVVITVCALMRHIFEPNNLYLGVHRPTSLVLIQILMIIFNLLPIYFLHKLLGYQVVYMGFILSTLVYFIVNFYLQKRFLEKLIFEKTKDLVKVFVLTGILLFTGYTLNFIIQNKPWLDLFSTPLILGVLAFLLIRNLSLITKKDIDIYLDDYRISKKVKKLFIN